MSAVEPTTLEEARALVDRIEDEWGRPHMVLNGVRVITLTDPVKEQIAKAIAALVADTIHRERYTA